MLSVTDFPPVPSVLLVHAENILFYDYEPKYTNVPSVRIILTSSTSFNHRSRPSNDHLLVISYTSKTPWAPREYDRMIVQNLPWPEVSHNCSFTRFPSKRIVVVL